ncbi:MAG: FkbM family methyltransferase [Gemmatimonadales bacterium]|nr:MAG: FkbM family methyltransferase [Gemmatimonadales bacterium]
MEDRLARLAGVLRSLVIYWRPGRQSGLRKLYRPFVAPNALVFDIGAHLGDRTRAFATLGARVVALEPQPHLMPWLKILVGRHPRVELRAEAVGAWVGTATLAISRRNPTVSSASGPWRETVGARPEFEGVSWEEAVTVPMTTLDRLIERHGVPDFCKIDVEGFEAEVVAGLSHPLPALSLEFVTGAPGSTLEALERLVALGDYRFNAVRGEQRSFHFPAWRSASEVRGWLESGADGMPSGDLYARLEARLPDG